LTFKTYYVIIMNIKTKKGLNHENDRHKKRNKTFGNSKRKS